MNTSPWRCITLILALSVPAVTQANEDVERETLTKLIHELQALEPLIHQAETVAAMDARVRFQYDWLRQDLARVLEGIRAHLEAPRAQPRTFPPLRGDYRR